MLFIHGIHIYIYNYIYIIIYIYICFFPCHESNVFSGDLGDLRVKDLTPLVRSANSEGLKTYDFQLDSAISKSQA